MTSARKAAVFPRMNRRAHSAKYGVVFLAALLGLVCAGLVAQMQSTPPCDAPADAAPVSTPASPALGHCDPPLDPLLASAQWAATPPYLPAGGDAQPLPLRAEALPTQAMPLSLLGSGRSPGQWQDAVVGPASWVEVAEQSMPSDADALAMVAAQAEASEAPLPQDVPGLAESEATATPAAEAGPSPATKPRLKLPIFKSPKAEAEPKPATPAHTPAAQPQAPGPSAPLSAKGQPHNLLGASGGLKIPLAGTPPAERVTLRQTEGLISLATHNAPLSEVLMALARQQNLNIVCTENLRGNITVTLEKVPLPTVLDAVLSIAGCTWVLQDDVIYVTSTTDRTKLPPAVQGRQVRVFRLDFAAAADVEKAVKGMMSPVGQVFTTVAKNTDNRQTQELVIVEDLPNYLQTIAAYIEQIDQPPRQVLIEAHVLAITLDSADRCGVDLTALFKVLHHDMTFYAQGIANPAAPQAFFFTFDGSDLDVLIEALRTQSQAKTLASPKVLVLNGQEAKIQIGRQDGYRVVTTTETSAMESINFLDTGVLLTVTPRISRNGQVLMHVKPEVSDGQVQDGLPSKKTTEVQTDVMLPNGRGMVIGGLIRDTDVETQSKVPFFGDLYLVGKLFRRRELSKRREEIIITLIPRVVPGTLACDDRHAQEVQQAETRLLDRNLERVPRPWDGRLPDALEKPARLRDVPAIKARHPRCAAGCAECLDGAGSACGEAEPYYAPLADVAPGPGTEQAGQAEGPPLPSRSSP